MGGMIVHINDALRLEPNKSLSLGDKGMGQVLQDWFCVASDLGFPGQWPVPNTPGRA